MDERYKNSKEMDAIDKKEFSTSRNFIYFEYIFLIKWPIITWYFQLNSFRN